MVIAARFISLWLLSAAAAVAQVPSAASPTGASRAAARGPSLMLSLQAAQAALDVCRAKGARVSVSVVDSADTLKVLLADDGADAKAVTTSTAKAVTARDFNTPISELAGKKATDPAVAAKAKSNPNYIIGATGGLPLRVGKQVIGAIGVGGGHRGTVDEDCARAGLDRIRAQLK